MRAFIRSWWFRQGVIFVVAEVLGYLLSIELRDRYPQEICFIGIFFVIAVIDEWRIDRKARRRLVGKESPQLSNAAAAQREAPNAAAAQREAPNATAAQREAPNATAAQREAPNALAARRLAPNAFAARREAPNATGSTKSKPAAAAAVVIPLRPPGA
jgi:hypothetical protein